jgi:hypothetical protein
MVRRYHALYLCIFIFSALSGCKRENPPAGFKEVLTAQDEWFYSGTSKSVIGALYKGETPMTVIYHGSTDMYLQKRNRMLADSGVNASDIGSDLLTSNSKTIVHRGVSYGIVVAEYPFLQLATVSKEDDRGYYTVTCARYKNTPEISLASGFCADAVREKLGAHLVQ